MDKKEVKKDGWRKASLIYSIKNALSGILHIFSHHYNARLIFLSEIFAILLGFYLEISKLEIFVLGVAMMIVFFAEVINTIVEDITNLITLEFHPRIKIIKDVAAGVVLVAIFFSVIMGYFIFMNRILALWKAKMCMPQIITKILK